MEKNEGIILDGIILYFLKLTTRLYCALKMVQCRLILHIREAMPFGISYVDLFLSYCNGGLHGKNRAEKSFL